MKISGLIDHSYLKVDCKLSHIETLCKEAIEHNFIAICIPPYYVDQGSKLLKDSDVKIATVIGFPMGYSATPAKVEEVKKAINMGADELDVVINISAVKDGNWAYLKNEIDSVLTATHMRGKILKLILQTTFLTDEEIKKLCEICIELKVDFVKTSTGFNDCKATVEKVKLLRANLPDSISIKASGGINSLEKLNKMLEAGASRIGTSSGVKIISEET